jgi:hypothetical protein
MKPAASELVQVQAPPVNAPFFDSSFFKILVVMQRLARSQKKSAPNHWTIVGQFTSY